MRELPVDLDEDTLEALEAERRLVGFESRAAYVRWIVDSRGSISDGSDEGNGLLDAYRQRIDELERRLEAAEFAAHSSEGAETVDEDEDADPDPENGPVDEQSNSQTRGEKSDEDDTWRRWAQDPTIEVRGRPRRTVRRAATDEQSAESTDCGSPAEAISGGSTVQVNETDRQQERDGESRPPADADSAALTPERVVRIAEDPVAADADVLESVEVERLDEFSRRAVAKTRERLDRDVETGLDYRSTPPLTNEDARPGADLVDLEALSVPGRSEEQLARRRAVAGQALAFLRDERQARKADFVEGFYETSPAGYETPESWWSFLKTVFRQVEAVDGGDSARTWRYTG